MSEQGQWKTGSNGRDIYRDARLVGLTLNIEDASQVVRAMNEAGALAELRQKLADKLDTARGWASMDKQAVPGWVDDLETLL